MTMAASLTMAEAACRRWDVVVGGAGPAGSTAAYSLAKRGLDVLLVDRAAFPRSKVCGCCLNGTALAALNMAGLGALPVTCGAQRLTDICLAAPGRSSRLPLKRSVVLSRELFDTALVRAAVAAGAAFLPRTLVQLGSLSADARTVVLDSGGRSVNVLAKVVIAADGLGGRMLARAGLGQALPVADARVGAGVIVDIAPDFYQPGIVHMACGADGYVGLVRLEDNRLDIAAALDFSRVRVQHGPGPIVARILHEVGWPVPPGLAELHWHGTLPLTRQAQRLAAERVFTVGDAAGYVEPFTGEGIARALTAGLAVTPLATRAVHCWDSTLERKWFLTYRRVVGGRQLICRTAAAILRRPYLTRALIGLLFYVPELAAPVVRCLDTSFSISLTSELS